MNGFSASKSASKSIMRIPGISAASESSDNSKSGLASVTGGNSRAWFSLFWVSSIDSTGLVIVLAVSAAIVVIGLSLLTAVGWNDVTAGNSDARTSCTDTVITSTGFLAGAVAFPFPTMADLPLDGSGC